MIEYRQGDDMSMDKVKLLQSYDIESLEGHMNYQLHVLSEMNASIVKIDYQTIEVTTPSKKVRYSAMIHYRESN